jgi:hypothetical protein
MQNEIDYRSGEKIWISKCSVQWLSILGETRRMNMIRRWKSSDYHTWIGCRWSIKASVRVALNVPQFISWHSLTTSCKTKWVKYVFNQQYDVGHRWKRSFAWDAVSYSDWAGVVLKHVKVNYLFCFSSNDLIDWEKIFALRSLWVVEFQAGVYKLNDMSFLPKDIFINFSWLREGRRGYRPWERVSFAAFDFVHNHLQIVRQLSE